MSVTPTADLAGILPVVISGGRPALGLRCTTRLLPGLHGITADPVWLVREDRAPAYERDGHEVVTFGVEEAEAWAESHWFAPEPYRRGGFLGGFTEREWACRLAAERGFWAVLQLDDNIRRLDMFTGYAASTNVVKENGGLGLFADLLAAVTRSTNSRMTGAKMSAVNPRSEAGMFARPGFPYSLFLERVDRPDREPYYGPFEDDILHAYQYASRADDATTALVYPISYTKEHVVTAKTGMRAAYNHRRAAGLVAVAPEVARAMVIQGHSNGRGEARVFHRMKAGAVGSRTPLVVRDRELFDAARDRCVELREQIKPRMLADAEVRVGKRAAKAASRQALLNHLAGSSP